MAAMWHCPLVNNLCSNSNFNFFHGIEHQASQFTVKYIELYDLLKGYRNDEGMIGLWQAPLLSVSLFGRGLILRVCCITWASASEIKRENPVKSENLPGCAVQVGSVAGIIAYNVSNRAFDVKLYFTRVHAFHMTTAFKAPTIFRNNILKNQLHSITIDKKIAASKALSQRPSNAATKSDWRALLSGLFMVLVGRVEVR